MLGKSIGGFEILEQIGRGGMGVVYRARQLSLEREVALKTLLPGLALDEALVERFQAEARAASRTNHPNLVQLYDVGSHEGTHYMAMELVEGESLASLIRREGSMEFSRAAGIASHVAAALGALHSVGVVHRDVKPSNILVRPDGVVKVTDFGVALLQEGGRRLTMEGTTVGTADYMSPEQARGEEPDGRSDIYSLGVVLYEMLAGRVPFGAETALAAMKKHCDEPPPSMRRSRPDVPDRLAEAVSRCLQKAAADRYQTAEALSGELDHVRLELEFARLSAETPAAGMPTAYSTRTVASLRRQREAEKPLLVRLGGGALGGLGAAWRYAAGTLDRDVAAMRRSSGRMEQALSELAEAKQKRSELRRQAEQLRQRGESARRESGEAFDADEVARAEELVEEEKRCDAAAVDFETVAEGLNETVHQLEQRYKQAEAEHERLRMKVELKKARQVQASLARPATRRKRRIILAAACLLGALAVLLVVGHLWRGAQPLTSGPEGVARSSSSQADRQASVIQTPPHRAAADPVTMALRSVEARPQWLGSYQQTRGAEGYSAREESGKMVFRVDDPGRLMAWVWYAEQRIDPQELPFIVVRYKGERFVDVSVPWFDSALQVLTYDTAHGYEWIKLLRPGKLLADGRPHEVTIELAPWELSGYVVAVSVRVAAGDEGRAYVEMDPLVFSAEPPTEAEREG